VILSAAAACAAAAVGIGVAVATHTDDRSSPSAVVIGGTAGSSAYRAAFRRDGARVCMRLKFTEGESGDEASSDGCAAVHAVPVGLRHAMCDSRHVFLYGAAPEVGRLAVGRGATLQTQRLGSVRAYVVALSARHLPATFAYTAAAGRRPWSVRVPALATACRAQSGIEHPTDTVGWLP
jgi:hypothetical protein